MDDLEKSPEKKHELDISSQGTTERVTTIPVEVDVEQQLQIVFGVLNISKKENNPQVKKLVQMRKEILEANKSEDSSSNSSEDSSSSENSSSKSNFSSCSNAGEEDMLETIEKLIEINKKYDEMVDWAIMSDVDKKVEELNKETISQLFFDQIESKIDDLIKEDEEEAEKKEENNN